VTIGFDVWGAGIGLFESWGDDSFGSRRVVSFGGIVNEGDGE
jgi:hypothetical protein